jgi:hypothetical protein
MFISGKTKYYFTAGKKVFYKDIDALTYASQNRDEVKFHLDFDFFKKEKRDLWLIEPERDINYYWSKHAKILQNKYSKLYLPYSGGTDSNTILQIFLNNDIKNITLINLTQKELDKTLDELKFPVKLISEKYRNQLQNFEYNTISFNENYLVPKYNLAAWEKTLNEFPIIWNVDIPVSSYNSLLKWSNYLYTDTEKLLTLKDNDCVIYGYEKPKIRFKDGWWGWQIHNEFQFIDNRIPFNNQQNSVYFFISDDVPEIQIKMSWMMIRVIKKLLTQYNFPITTSSVDQIQEDKSFFYTKIIKGLGLDAVTPLLNTKLLHRPGGKAIRDIRPELSYGQYYKEFTTISENYTKKAIKTIDAKFLEVSSTRLKKIYSDFIPICQNETV